jgi:hypothetical protein
VPINRGPRASHTDGGHAQQQRFALGSILELVDEPGVWREREREQDGFLAQEVAEEAAPTDPRRRRYLLDRRLGEALVDVEIERRVDEPGPSGA